MWGTPSGHRSVLRLNLRIQPYLKPVLSENSGYTTPSYALLVPIWFAYGVNSVDLFIFLTLKTGDDSQETPGRA